MGKIDINNIVLFSECQKEFVSNYQKLKMLEIIAIAHKPETMIKKCTYRGDDQHPACNLFKNNNGPRFLTSDFGVCYTFNFGPYISSLGLNFDMTAASLLYGLTLEIDIECKSRFIFV